MTLGKLVEGLFLSVQVTEGEEKGDPTDAGQAIDIDIKGKRATRSHQSWWYKHTRSFRTGRHSHGTGHVVPDEVGIVTERDEGFSDGSGYSVGQEGKRLDDGPHVTRCLGVGVFEDGDRGKDLRGGKNNTDRSGCEMHERSSSDKTRSDGMWRWLTSENPIKA
jgi:hypothetical protein